jgi:Tol biopolymer transport system component
MDIDGRNPKQITSGHSEYGVAVTPDSRWLLFDSTASGAPAIWKVSIDGGEPTPITKLYTENGEVSPDGKFVVCQFRENSVGQWKYAVFGIEGGDPGKGIRSAGRPRRYAVEPRWTRIELCPDE